MTATMLDRSRAVTPTTTRREAGLGATIRWEARKLGSQLRSKALLIGVVLAPIAVVIVVGAQSRPPKDTLFGRFATENGFAMALLVLGFASQWILPLVTAVVAGDIFASEDQHGTWKTVLTRSVSRTRLFWAKVEFTPPDFNGTVRVMAVAWTKTKIGHVSRDVIIRDAVALTASAPRFPVYVFSLCSRAEV